MYLGVSLTCMVHPDAFFMKGIGHKLKSMFQNLDKYPTIYCRKESMKSFNVFPVLFHHAA